MNYLFYMSVKVLMAAIVFSLCFVTAKASIRESVQIENPRVVLKVSETRILPFEAVSFALAVSNDSDEIHTINGIPLTFIEYRKVVPGKIGWTNYEKYNYGMSTISDPPLQPVNMFFAPNSVYELGIHTIDLI